MTTCCKATLCAEEQIYDRRSLCVRCAQILAVIKFVIQIGCATRSIFLALCPTHFVIAILTNCTALLLITNGFAHAAIRSLSMCEGKKRPQL